MIPPEREDLFRLGSDHADFPGVWVELNGNGSLELTDDAGRNRLRLTRDQAWQLYKYLFVIKERLT